MLLPLKLQVDLDYCKQKGIVVTNTPEVLTEDCADLAIALLLATMRQICSADRYVRKGCWPKQGTYPLSYKVLVITSCGVSLCMHIFSPTSVSS